MKIILNPVDGGSLEPITIEDTAFSIGRREEPFASQPEAKAARLSRRHARVFVEGGRAFVADLGSLNGTLLNHEPVSNDAAELQQGDELNLGGEFRFTVAVGMAADDDRTMIAPPPPVTVRLVPTDVESPLHELVISRFPYLISRKSAVFDALEATHPEAVKQLSRRHAVILLKGSVPYIEDLESANGTFVDGKRLEELGVPVASGTSVSFGEGMFSYHVLVDAEDFAKTIVALPGQTPGAVAPPVATSAAAAPLEPQANDVPQKEDLGWAQEPSVQESPAQEPSAQEPLSQEPPVASSVPASESITPSEIAPTAIIASNISEQLGPDRTRFIDSATSFLDVFLEQKQDRPEEEDTSGAAQATPGARGRLSANATALSDALGGESLISRRVKIFALAALALVGSVAGYVYFVDSDKRGIQDLIDSKAYANAAARANEYFADGGDQEEIGRLGTRALVRAVMKPWLQQMGEGNFPAAAETIDQASSDYPLIPNGPEMLALMKWMVDSQAHAMERPERDSPIEIFNHERTVARLVADWDAKANLNQRLSTQMAADEPSFDDYRKDAMSQLRTMREADSLYGKAIEQFKTDLRTHLDTGDVETARQVVRRFSKTYPKVVGLVSLQADLDRFADAKAALDEQNLLELVSLREQLRLNTPVVQSALSVWFDAELPDGEVAQQYKESLAAWKAGDVNGAVDALASIRGGTWADVAATQITHYQSIDASFQQLQQNQDRPGYRDDLMKFWSSLTATDSYFLSAVQDDFARYEGEILEQAQGLLKAARSSWRTYSEAGGIPGILRVEERTSRAFKRQAKALSDAYGEGSKALALMKLLNAQVSADDAGVVSEVSAEASRQRRWLQDLHIVLEPELLTEKLALLPNPKGED